MKGAETGVQEKREYPKAQSTAQRPEAWREFLGVKTSFGLLAFRSSTLNRKTCFKGE
jgi:hypothetical protein